MKYIQLSLFLLLSLLLAETYGQCTTTGGGTVCDSTITFGLIGSNPKALYSWNSFTTPVNGFKYIVISDSGQVPFFTDYTVFEVYTCCKKNVQLRAFAHNDANNVVKYNLDNYTCGGDSQQEHFFFVSESYLHLQILGTGCNPLNDTVTVWYRRLCTYPDQTGFSDGQWSSDIYKWQNQTPTIYNYGEYLGAGNTISANFTDSLGYAAPALTNSCQICPSGVSNDSFMVFYSMDSLFPRSFYKVQTNSANDLWLHPGGGSINAPLLDYFNDGRQHITGRERVALISPYETVYTQPYNVRSNGSWKFLVKKDTGDYKANVSFCKMDGDYTWGTNVWKGYVFDSTFSGSNNSMLDKYMGYLNPGNDRFGYDWGSGQPGFTNGGCGVSMDNNYYRVHFLMKSNFASGKYKFRVRSASGGNLRLTDREANTISTIFNTSIGTSYDQTSSYYTLSGDTFMRLIVYKQTANSRISFNYVKEPKLVGHLSITAGGGSYGDTVCAGSVITLAADTADGTETQWYIKVAAGTASTSTTVSGAILAGTGSSITVTPDSSTTYYVRNRYYSKLTNDTLNVLDVYSPSWTTRRLIRVAVPSAPTAPAAQSACSDTAYTFVFDSVVAGSGGNQIEWSGHSNFDTSTVIGSGGDISLTVDAGETDTLWLRSRVSSTGCVSSSVWTTAKVNTLPEPPTAPAPQSVSSDTAYDFVFDSISVGFGGNALEWSFDSSFTSYTTDTPLCSIAFTVPVDSFQMFWLRSVDTATGCKSEARAGIGISQNIYKRQPITVDSVINVCSGTAAAIKINSSVSGKKYLLLTDTGTVRSGIGNGGLLTLNTANVSSPTFYHVWKIDTVADDTTILGDGILVNPVGAVDTNVYIEGDTLVYVADSALYNASAMYGIKAIYSLHSGSATVDSLTGYVYNISGNKFTLRATLYGATGCGSVTDTLRVRVTDVGELTPPPALTVYIDSITQITAFVFDSITAGANGNEIEWATNDSFANSTIVAVPATISITLNGIADTTIWLRSIDNRTGRHSRATNTRAVTSLPYLSAGLLDKSRWTLDEDKSDEFDWLYTLPKENNDNYLVGQKFEDKWNLIYMWGGGKAGTTEISDPGSYTLSNNTPRGETQLFDWGMCPYNSSPCDEPGCAGEVYFEDGIMHMKAERFPNAPIIETVNTDGGSFDAPFYYHSGLLSSVEMFPLVNSMWEIRWKLPQEANGYSAFPTFWNYRGGTNFTIVDGGSDYRANGNVDDPLGSCGIETNKLTECGYTDDWHTFTAVTTETEIIYFIDGKEKWSNKFSVANASQQNNPLTARWPTDIYTGSTAEVPIFINLQVYDWSCPSYWDDPTCVRQPPTWQTCELLVDYFRYYSPANPSNTQMLQNIQSGIAKTLESPVNDGTVITPANLTPPNHNVLPIANTIHGTSHQVHWSEKMAYTNEQGLVKIYYSGTDAPLSTFFKCYNAYYDNGNWYDYALLDWVTDVYGEITVDEDRVYYVTRNSGTTPNEIKFFQWMGNSWANFSTHCQGTSLNVDQFGRLWFIGLDDDIHLWTPNGGQITGGLTDITSDGLEKRGLSVHPSGILFFYTDDNNDMKQVLWNFPNTWVNYGTVASGVMPHSMTQDEINTRVYFIGDDKDVHYYSLNLAGTGVTKKLGNACEQYDNANWEWYAPVLSHDKKMVFYQSDDDEIWYYFNDQDINNRENWYRTPLQYGTKSLGHFAIEPWNFGRLFYVNNAPNSSIDCLHYVDWVDADNPVDCPMTSNPQQTAFYKTDETENIPQQNSKQVNKIQSPVGIRVFPNPSASGFEFTLTEQGRDFGVEIVDIHSRVIESKKCDDLNRCVWNAENIPNGVYFYKIKSNNGKIFTGKLIKL